MLWVLLLLVAWGAAAVSCIRLCLLTAGAAHPQPRAARAPVSPELTLYETAFLAGGPQRVADLALVSMHLRRRLLLAHTGWATVVDPEGRDEVERTVIRAIGPEGQSRIGPDPGRRGGGRCRTLPRRPPRRGGPRRTARGPHGPGVRGAGRTGRGGAGGGPGGHRHADARSGHGYAGPVAAWFGLPLVLTLGCLAIARVENHPYSPWASPSGQRWLDSLPAPVRGADRDLLAAVAVRGVRALEDPGLRAAMLSGARNGG